MAHRKAPKGGKQRNANKTKQRVQRTVDPVKLLLERGQAGKGMVLAPVQTSVLAKYVIQLNVKLAQLDAILQEALKDQEEVEGPDTEVEDEEAN